MSVRRKVRSVEVVFRDLDKRIEDFKRNTQLNCVAGCGLCCRKPDIEATVTEFLPLAFYFYLNDLAEEKLILLKENPHPVCLVFKEGVEADTGICTLYLYRGLICRLFGFSARRNKYGEPEYTTCRKIKEAQPEKYVEAYLAVKSRLSIPLMGPYYQRLLKVDFEASLKFYPINIAIRKAIEQVLAYYSYRKGNPGLKRKTQSRGTMPSPGVSQDLISDPQ
jgi:Fe-S-cluster containining protein